MKTESHKEVYISGAFIIDDSSPFNGKKTDLIIKNGIITEIGKNLKQPFDAVIFTENGLCVSPGFADIHVNVQDPGYEYKESIESAMDAAIAGGFTGILSCSTTLPAIDGKSGIEYQLKNAKNHLCDFWASGTISKGRLGKELSEMFDMHRSGALAFYDFKSEIEDSRLLKLALLYSKSFDALIMVHPAEKYLTSGGVVNEGIMSTKNGLQGIPAIAEELGVQRALKLAEYSDKAIHLTSISTLESIELVKKAKQKGQKVTCGVSVANLLFNESVLEGFDSNFKLNPPLRDEKTRKSLIDALSKGIIDVVISDHWPQNVEGKECEFETADFGMNTLETSFSMLRTATLEKIELAQLVRILTKNPREILKLPIPSIDINKEANITIFHPDKKWKYDVNKSLSQSRNNSINQELTGTISGVVNNQKVFSNHVF